MNKIENHKQDLAPLFDEFFASGDAGKLTAYLAAHSNLPGPRGNLELAAAFGDMVGQYAPTKGERLWELCATLTAVSAEEASVNDPREFIPLCGAVGIGVLGAACPTLFAAAMPALRTLANDPRWRMREAVAMALQRLIVKHPREVLGALERWTAEGSPLQMRAAAAGVAEPVLLKDTTTARAALALHETVFDRLPEITNRKSAEFKALRKGLGYTLSVAVQALPEEGFALMRALVAAQDKDVLWIVKENLKKNRLVKNFPAEVESVKTLV